MPGICCVAQADGIRITNVNTDAAMHAPGAGVTIYVDLENTTALSFSGSIGVGLSHLGNSVADLPAQPVVLDAGQTGTRVFAWNPPATDYRGYLVQVTLLDDPGDVTARGASAVDVSSHWRRFPRYGYMSHFGAGLDAWNAVWHLKNHHINGIQFYDWAWKHHQPTPPAGWSSWPDIANRQIDRVTLSDTIAAAHSYNMMAMSYHEMGSGYDDCLADGSGVTFAMGRFSGTPATTENQHIWAMPGGWATPRLRLMNPRDAAWQNYMFGRVNEAFSAFAFDGWHIDNLVPVRDVYDAAGDIFNVDDYEAPYVNNAKTALGGKSITFNTVDGGALDQVARFSNADFIYSELWGGNARFDSLRPFVDRVRRVGAKATVFAAYVNRGLSSGFFNEPGVRLANAAIFANGAAHLELGDGREMLHTEYFPDRSVQMSDSLRASMRTYYDFLTAYQNLLRDDTVSTDRATVITGVPTSTNGSPGTVWTIARRRPGAAILHLVNLRNSTSPEWRDTDGSCPPPALLTNLAVKMYYTGKIAGGKLRIASPDRDFAAATELAYTTGSDAGGSFISFTVPQLRYWEMIWLEMNGTTDPASLIRAENFVSWAGVNTEPYTDAGGGNYVGFVRNMVGESYIVFENVAFSSGASSVEARVASAVANGNIEFRLGTPDGPLIATIPVGNTGGWQSWRTVSAPVSGVTGSHRLYAVFKNAESNLNWFQFTLLPDSPAVIWQQAKFGADWNNLGIAGHLADPDKDGHVNLIERALDGNPNAGGPGPLCQVSVSSGRLVLSFSRDTTQTDLTLAVQSADTPAGPWTDLALSASGAPFVPLAEDVAIGESGSGTLRAVEFSGAAMMTDPAYPRRFLRLRVSF